MRNAILWNNLKPENRIFPVTGSYLLWTCMRVTKQTLRFTSLVSPNSHQWHSKRSYRLVRRIHILNLQSLRDCAFLTGRNARKSWTNFWSRERTELDWGSNSEFNLSMMLCLLQTWNLNKTYSNFVNRISIDKKTNPSLIQNSCRYFYVKFATRGFECEFTTAQSNENLCPVRNISTYDF